jgi:hypothetical protein
MDLVKWRSGRVSSCVQPANMRTWNLTSPPLLAAPICQAEARKRASCCQVVTTNTPLLQHVGTEQYGSTVVVSCDRTTGGGGTAAVWVEWDLFHVGDIALHSLRLAITDEETANDCSFQYAPKNC